MQFESGERLRSVRVKSGERWLFVRVESGKRLRSVRVESMIHNIWISRQRSQSLTTRAKTK